VYQGNSFADTKHYLYGLECIAELVDTDEPESEWRYYHQDGNHLVRQTTNEQAEVTFAWTFSPEGAVVLGEKGPVTNLGCGAIYDWSTDLIFKQGRYFDPNSGIWLTMSGLVIYQGSWMPYNRQRKGSKNKKRLYWLLLLLLLVLTGCMTGEPTPVVDPTQVVEVVTETAVTKECVSTATATPSPTATDSPSPTATDNPTMQPPLDPTPPVVTVPSLPTETSTPTSTPLPMAGFQLSDPFGTEGNGFYWTCLFGDSDCGLPLGNHDGIDLVSKRYIDRSCSDSFPRCVNFDYGPPQAASMAYRTVYSPVTGVVAEINPLKNDQLIIDQVKNPSRPQDPAIDGLKIELFHLKPDSILREASAVIAGQTRLGYFDDFRPHLHLGLIENGQHRDPYPWLPESNPPNFGPYYNARGGPYASLPQR
jgi:hypothetical protein